MSARGQGSWPKIKDLPFFDSMRDLSHKEKLRLGIISETGEVNEYRRAFVTGLGGNKKEETWDPKKHWHTCCKSKVPWRHKRNCPRVA